jgi:uncharacterized membrane protein YdjX (TVP38/TMEM64 family)
MRLVVSLVIGASLASFLVRWILRERQRQSQHGNVSEAWLREQRYGPSQHQRSR